MTILVVDDEETSLSLLEALVEDAEYTPIRARDGIEALTILQKNDVRLVISDWEMPRLDGVELRQKVRRNIDHYVYFVLLTSHSREEHLVQGLNAGADGFMTKPVNPAELAAQIRVGERVLALEMRDVAIFALAKLAESRDYETGTHLERVQAYCEIITAHLVQQNIYRDTMEDDFPRLISRTSPLHDIGKVGIPDSILLKPGRLTDREFEIMKNPHHRRSPDIGGRAEKVPQHPLPANGLRYHLNPP